MLEKLGKAIMKRVLIILVCIFILESQPLCAQYLFSITEIESLIKNDFENIHQKLKLKNYVDVGKDKNFENNFELKGYAHLSPIKSTLNSILYIIYEPNKIITKKYQDELSLNYKKVNKYNKLDGKYICDFTISKNGDLVIVVTELYSGSFSIDKNSTNSIEVNGKANINRTIYSKRINQNKIEINSFTNATDIIFKKGDKISFNATGNIKVGDWVGYASPNGKEGYTSYNKVGGFKHGSLLGKIGNGEWFLIGESSTILADRDGVLSVIVNDNDPDNNEGIYTLEYSILKSNKYNQQKINEPPTSIPSNKPSTVIANTEINNTTNTTNTSSSLFYIGKITNKSLKISDGCIMTLISNPDGSYILYGRTDNKKLVGRWDLDGKLSGNTYIFRGDILLDGEGSDWPIGTKAPIIISLYKTSNGIKGFYTIMDNYNGVDRQEGEFALNQK